MEICWAQTSVTDPRTLAPRLVLTCRAQRKAHGCSQETPVTRVPQEVMHVGERATLVFDGIPPP